VPPRTATLQPGSLAMALRRIIAIAICVAAPAVLAHADANPQRYAIKQDRPDTGSHLKRDQATSGFIPLNRRYSELSPEQQAFLKSDYEGLGPDDEPPFPRDGLETVLKAMAEVQRAVPAQGMLTLVVSVDAAGVATDAQALEAPNRDVAYLAAHVLMLEKYKPGICQGSPCAMQYLFRMHFTLR
jgi:hypothetical protein